MTGNKWHHVEYSYSFKVDLFEEKHYLITYTKTGKRVVRYYKKPLKSPGALSFWELFNIQLSKIEKWPPLCIRTPEEVKV